MHLSIAEKAGLTLVFLIAACLPLSYVWTAARALRDGRLEMVARGVPVSIVRSEQPTRFAFSVWGLLISMALLTATCCAFASLGWLSR